MTRLQEVQNWLKPHVDSVHSDPADFDVDIMPPPTADRCLEDEIKHVGDFLRDEVKSPYVEVTSSCGASAYVPTDTLRYMAQLVETARNVSQVSALPHNGTETSRDAAEQGEDNAAALRHQIYQFAARMGSHGLTADEADAHFGWGHQTTSARVSEMANKYKVLVPTGRKRKTRKGRQAMVYVTDAQHRIWGAS
jgi:hypothetical protein